jgi:hypothetical protein
VKKSEKPRFYGQNKVFSYHPTLHPLGNFSHLATCKSSSKNTQKMNLKPVLNKTSPCAHMELELDVLGVPGKLVKYVVYSSKRRIEKIKIKIKILHTSCSKCN